MDNLRTFIGIDIKPSDELLGVFYKLKNVLRDDSIKWVDTSTLHLTLLFLGETENIQVSQISAELQKELQLVTQFSIKIKGIGTFGRPDPKVIWAGFETNDELLALKQKVDKILLPFGFEDKNKVYSPHLTLGRVKFLKSKQQLRDVLQLYKDKAFQDVLVDKVIFYQSTLTAKGALYRPIKVFPLK